VINETMKDAEMRMKKSIEALKNEFNRMRSGRAHPGILDPVMVPYYGNDTPLSQVASITVEDARTLAVSPYEKNLVPVIEKAIIGANLGLNPATAGTTIRVPLPPLNEERRREMVKVVRNEAENARVAIRNIRRDANNAFKDALKAKKINEDDERQGQDKVQKLTDKIIQEVETLLASKEKDLMEV